jgi:hypothetical protein
MAKYWCVWQRLVVVFKNNTLSFVELEMKAAGFLEFATDLHNVRLCHRFMLQLASN